MGGARRYGWSGFTNTAEYCKSLPNTFRLFAKRAGYVRDGAAQAADKAAAGQEMAKVSPCSSSEQIAHAGHARSARTSSHDGDAKRWLGRGHEKPSALLASVSSMPVPQSMTQHCAWGPQAMHDTALASLSFTRPLPAGPQLVSRGDARGGHDCGCWSVCINRSCSKGAGRVSLAGEHSMAATATDECVNQPDQQCADHRCA